MPPKKVTGPFTICHIRTAYTDSHGKYFETEPIEVQVDIVALENPVAGAVGKKNYTPATNTLRVRRSL